MGKKIKVLGVGVVLLMLTSIFALEVDIEQNNLVANGDFSKEGLSPKGVPKNWSLRNFGDEYIDGKRFSSKFLPAEKAYRITVSDEVPIKTYGIEQLLQDVPAGTYLCSVKIKTENVKDSNLGAYVHMIDKAVNPRDKKVFVLGGKKVKQLDKFFVKGTTDWRTYSFRFKIPEAVKIIRLVLLFHGHGTFYFSNVELSPEKEFTYD